MGLDHSLLCLLGIFITFFITVTLANESLIGAKIAKDNEFPYQVSLQLPKIGHSCGGGIIDVQFILTAGHCVVDKNYQFHNDIIIVAGTQDLRKIDKPAFIGHVSKIFVPREYSRTSSDIAVIKLKHSLTLWRHKNLKVLDLPAKSTETYAGNLAKLAAWGQFTTENHEVQVSDELRFSEADILDTEKCQEGYKFERITDKHLCARVKQHADNETSGTCRGDSGSPLVVNGKVVVAVLSRGPIGCTEKVRAGIYTRVTSYLYFIHNAMKEKSNYNIISHEVH